MKTKCPNCNYLATEHEVWGDEKVEPKMGDFSFCINCSQINQFTEAGLIKGVIDELDEETKSEIKEIDSAWLQTRRLLKMRGRK